jgi:hypothetical protein
MQIVTHRDFLSDSRQIIFQNGIGAFATVRRRTFGKQTGFQTHNTMRNLCSIV